MHVLPACNSRKGSESWKAFPFPPSLSLPHVTYARVDFSTGVDTTTLHACCAMLLPRCHHISLFPISFPVPSLWWSSSDAGLTEMSEQKFKIALDFNLFGCFIATPVRGWLWRAKVVMENGVLVFAAIFCPSLLFCRVTKVRGFLLFPTFIKF